ncbi:PAS domain-containing protein [uncultured Thiothrix sp.]|uniref:PAS domain-containing protein n=1 Tax=uncultured Thiothrix sp. TaxID=223185 RepID=UPI00262CBAD6|nr:PAS domain-containing protein [uncultured Thiothrix sp.]
MISPFVQLIYHDGTMREVLIKNEEIPFPEGKLIVSRTDLAGIITHCNPSFIEMSGYQHEELIGRPHHILRHPDMPAAAFQDLWDTIQQGKQWHGYVKNLRKDGCFYWVYATVIPNIRDGSIIGYTSVRRKPSRAKVQECIQLYAQMNEAGAAV